MKKVQGNDSFQRINYLYQISKLVGEHNPILAAYYGNLIVNVAKKNVLKLHPDMKREICKKCRIVMVNNVSKITKIKTINRTKCVEVKCGICGHKRNFKVDKDNICDVWIHKLESQLENQVKS